MATATWSEKPATPTDPFAELSGPLGAAEAVVEADRCLECGGPYAAAPCTLACPAGVDVPAFVAAIALGDPEAAANIVFAENLLGGTCARVCPVETLCQGACLLAHEGQPPIQIARLQRYATEHALGRRLPLRRQPRPSGRRVAVVGAGPAGLACAGELAARGYSVTVYDERIEVGGLVRFAIAPYRQQCAPLPQEAQALADLGVHVELGFRIAPASLDVLEREADAIVLAVGMGADADVHYPGDELPGVWESLSFIEAIKTGAPPPIGRSVVVIGGGNTAIDVAREAVRLGAISVTIVYRRTEAEMPAYPHEVAEARAEGVAFRWLATPIRCLGDGRLAAVACREVRLGPRDASGRPRPEKVPGSDFVLPADTAVKAIGQRGREEFAAVAGLEFDGGRLCVDPKTGRTGNPKYYAAGDVANGGATVVEAVRQAKIVARAIDEAIGEAA